MQYIYIYIYVCFYFAQSPDNKFRNTFPNWNGMHINEFKFFSSDDVE